MRRASPQATGGAGPHAAHLTRLPPPPPLASSQRSESLPIRASHTDRWNARGEGQLSLLTLVDFLSFFFWLQCSMRILSSPTRDRTCGPCMGNVES